jgi:hypothetical protein
MIGTGNSEHVSLACVDNPILAATVEQTDYEMLYIELAGVKQDSLPAQLKLKQRHNFEVSRII